MYGVVITHTYMHARMHARRHTHTHTHSSLQNFSVRCILFTETFYPYSGAVDNSADSVDSAGSVFSFVLSLV